MLARFMQLSDLDFDYPPELVATEPRRPSRIAFFGPEPEEMDMPSLLERFQAGDILVLNESEVIPARVFSREGAEILFLESEGEEWQVLFPSRDYKVGDSLELPDDVTLTLVAKGLPQKVRPSRPLTHEYFAQHGDVALPPYIQEARGERRNRSEDRKWYQTAWAREPGSVAAPTASLHFSQSDLEKLEAKGVSIHKLTLHVGAGTFLPIRTQNLDEHVMHAERVRIPEATREALVKRKGRVWALGTTVTRALEAYARGEFDANGEGSTRLFIRPGFDFQIVDVLMTNFHQPRSTLLSLVAAFAGDLERVKRGYAWAIERKFRLFSYGDLSVWTK